MKGENDSFKYSLELSIDPVQTLESEEEIPAFHIFPMQDISLFDQLDKQDSSELTFLDVSLSILSYLAVMVLFTLLVNRHTNLKDKDSDLSQKTQKTQETVPPDEKTRE